MANLNKEQTEAVYHKDGPCLVLAGPGSGKTFTLSERIKYLIEEEHTDPRSIVVITFSRKAAESMALRFEKITENKWYPVYFCTFHAFFYGIIRNYYNLPKESIISESMKTAIINKAYETCKNDALLCGNGDKDKAVTDSTGNDTALIEDDFKLTVISNISRYKNSININKCNGNDGEINNYSNNSGTYDVLSGMYSTDEEKKLFIKIYEAYVRECRKRKLVDFDDMQIMCRDILLENSTLLMQYRALYRYYLIDEFQDINDIQYEIMRLLAGENKNVFAVGDDDQSIYAFRGSDPQYMQKFITDYSDTFRPVKIINLIKNYRCPECVIDAAVGLISNNNNRINKIQKSGKKDRADGSVNVHIAENALTEADYVIDVIKSEYREYFWSNDDLTVKKTNVMSCEKRYTFAVLYRTKKCADIMEERFKEEGILYKRSGEKSGYYEREWIKDITAYLMFAISDDDKYLYRVLNRPDRSILRDDTEKINELKNKIKPIRDMSPYAAVIYILKALGYESFYFKCKHMAGADYNKASDELNEFINLSRKFKSINEWLNNRDNNTLHDDNTSYNHDLTHINMLTAHASKGLEYDVVFIIGLQEGLFPHRKAITADAIEEERRLLYVAMTRARKHLYVIGLGNDTNGKRVSSFIREIPVVKNCNGDLSRTTNNI